MAAFLWVEDFDGGTYRTTSHDVFGHLAGEVANIPDDKEDLQDYLATKNIYLETSLIDALRFIDDKEQLAKIDYVVLDIDLKIVDDPEDELPNQDLLAAVLRWYETLPEAEQRKALKKVAGYHLWTRLVVDSGFPRERIQFCSQHGEYQESIKKSFDPARISSPTIFRKGDGQASDWIDRQSRDPYTSLRRNVIDYCYALESHLNFQTDNSPRMLRFANFPGKTARDFKRHHAQEMLEMLPRYLPPLVPENSLPEILRGFARAMAMEWDRFDASETSRDELKQLTGMNYTACIESSIRCGASVMKLLRNTFSHASGKPTSIDCTSVALLFVMNMNVIYCLDGIDARTMPEDKLMANSPRKIFSADELLLCMQQEKSVAEKLAQQAEISLVSAKSERPRSLGELLRALQDKSSSEYQQDAVKWLFRMLWHELTYGADDAKKLARRVAEIGKSSDPVHRVAMACLDRAFFNAGPT
jgi:hypothetical protein